MAAPRSKELLTRINDMPWIPMMEGIDFKLLRVSPDTGSWTVVFHCAEGSSFPSHKHLGAGEYYVIRGEMHYREGVACTGDYGYEPIGVIHDETKFVQETELLFTNHGAVLFKDEDGKFSVPMDYEVVFNLAEQHAENERKL